MGEISTVTLLDGVTYDIKDAKSRMTILKYGSSTWTDFITAYDNKAIVYCRASSNSNPGTGSQTRLAFMAYVNNETTPTEVEFQYYRSVSSHSDSQQGDQVYVYKLNKTTGWSVTTRNAFTKVIAGTGLTSSFTTGTSSSITLSFDTADASDVVYDNTASGLSSTSVQGAIDEVSSDINKSNAVFINFSATGHFLDEEYEATDGWWTFDSITDAYGNSLTYTDLFSAFQDGKNIFLNATSTIQSSTYYYKNIQMSGVDVTVTDPNTVYYVSFDFVDGVSNDPSTWRVWVVIYDSVDPFIYQINVDKSDADNIRYSNTASGLTATDVQDAIDEVVSDISNKSTVSVTQTISTGTKIGTITVDGTDTDLYAPSGGSQTAAQTSYDNAISGLSATNVQDAVDELNTEKAPSAITTTTALANGDGIIFADSSDSDKIKRSSISFDGSTTTKALTQAGTWETFTDNNGTVTSVTIKGTSPIVCSNSSAITGSGTRTISLDAGEARTALGTKYGILSKSQTSVDVSSSTSTFTALDNISTADGLTTGYWLVQATINFQSNASGYRVAVISQSTTISSANGWGTVIVGASPSDVTRIQVMALMNITSTTTPIHVFVKQNSGSKLTCATTMRAFRLSL